MNSDIFESALELWKAISMIQPRKIVWNNIVSDPESHLASNEILKKAERCILCRREWPVVEFIRAFFAGCWLHFLTWIIQYQYLYTKNFKGVNTYHQVFCYPESVNTKQENPMIYGTNFTQCVCTGYCESWILSLPSFIMKPWWHL